MNNLRMIACWLIAIATAAGLFALFARPLPMPDIDMPEADVAVIGTSLVAYGVPQYRKPEQEVFPGKTHFRIGLPSATREELLYLLDEAIDQKPELVLFEINQFVLTFNNHKALRVPAKGPMDLAVQTFLIARQNVRARTRWTMGLSTNAESRFKGSVLRKSAPPGPQRTRLAKLFYPLHVMDQPPIAGLRERIERARRRGVEIVFLLPPRSARGEALVGRDTSERISANARSVAEQLNVELIEVGTGWDDELFTSLAHLNQLGRARYVGELQEWFDRRP